jgi:hypothetical protein
MHVAHPVEEARGLMRDRGDDARVRMSDVRDGEGAAEVEEPVPVDVPHVRARGAVPEDGRLRHETGDVAALDRAQALGERARARARDGGLELRCGGARRHGGRF